MPFLGAKPCLLVYNKQILKKKTENKPLYSVKMVFEDHWQNFKEKYKDTLREIEINEVEKMLSCKSEKRGDLCLRIV